MLRRRILYYHEWLTVRKEYGATLTMKHICVSDLFSRQPVVTLCRQSPLHEVRVKTSELFGIVLQN